MILSLTPKGILAVDQLKSKFATLYPHYGRNTFDRVQYELGFIPAYVVMYALSTPSRDDIVSMIRDGYATSK